jgi:transmembrane sensor
LTDERETSRSIDEKAADWIARLDRGPLSEEEAQALEFWLHGDPRRCGALLRAGSLALLSESARSLVLRSGSLPARGKNGPRRGN